EIDLLVSQATAEASRHETRRAQAAEKIGDDSGAEQYEQLLLFAKRAALMETQVEVLEGKKRTMTRYRDAVAASAEASASPSSTDADQRACDQVEASPLTGTHAE